MAGPGRLSLLQICGSYKSLHIYRKNKDQEGEVTLCPQREQRLEELDMELEYPKSPKGLHVLELAPICLSAIPLELPVLCLLKGTGVPMLVFQDPSHQMDWPLSQLNLRKRRIVMKSCRVTKLENLEIDQRIQQAEYCSARLYQTRQ